MERADNQNTVERVSLDTNAATIAPPVHANLASSNKVVLVIDYIFWILVAVTLLRFAFKLIGANSHNAFVTLIFNATNPTVNIFKGIVGDIVSGSMVIEFSSLISIVIMWLIYKAVLRGVAIAK